MLLSSVRVGEGCKEAKKERKSRGKFCSFLHAEILAADWSSHYAAIKQHGAAKARSIRSLSVALVIGSGILEGSGVEIPYYTYEEYF